MNRKVVQGWVGILCILISGAMIGSSATFLYTKARLNAILQRNELPSQGWLVETLRGKLDLSDKQANSIAKLYGESSVAFDITTARARPILNQPRVEFVRRMYGELSAEQRKKLEVILRDRIRLTRHGVITRLLLELDLNLQEREQVEAILAKHATPELEEYSDSYAAFDEVLRRSEKEIIAVLPASKGTLYREFLRKGSRSLSGASEARSP